MLALPGQSFAGPADMDEATGYRIRTYRAPVGLPVQGGTRVELPDLDRLIKDGAVLVDVMPARAGFDRRTGEWRLADKRDDIPGSTWLPNTGQGKPEPRIVAYFAASLRKLTAGKLDKPIVVYCIADCWMSWNAVKRAAGLGYKQVYWFADGTDGWAQAGRDLVPARPPPVPDLGESPSEIMERPAGRE
jgi:Rhodanese-like domain.